MLSMRCSGAPWATTCPPAFPPSGPRAMIKSASAMMSRLCSMTETAFRTRWNRRMSSDRSKPTVNITAKGVSETRPGRDPGCAQRKGAEGHGREPTRAAEDTQRKGATPRTSGTSGTGRNTRPTRRSTKHEREGPDDTEGQTTRGRRRGSGSPTNTTSTSTSTDRGSRNRKRRIRTDKASDTRPPAQEPTAKRASATPGRVVDQDG